MTSREPTVKPKTGHILNAASNLLGISLLIITGLHLTGRDADTLADEIAWAASICFSGSCLLSYLSLRTVREAPRSEAVADRIFLAGLVLILVSVLVLALGHPAAVSHRTVA